MIQKLVYLYLAVINILAYIYYAWDKRKAIKNHYRISEGFLLSLTILGGGCGAYLAAQVYRHKTRKWYFKLAWLLGLAIDICILYYLLQ